jgi:acetyl-CoA hydrolase/succinyl-CoA:acetate CoA-transferase
VFADRIRYKPLLNKISTPEQAASLIKDGMTVGMSGFTKAGDAKAVPLAMARRAATDPFKITLITGASLGYNVDQVLAEAGVLARRLPFQNDDGLRKAINSGQVMFIDQHLSETVETLRSKQMPPIDIAVVEAVAITENGGIVPTTSIGNSASFAILAPKVIVELNMSHNADMEGLHDVYIPTKRPSREAIPVTTCSSRVGLPYIPIAPEKIVAIVITNKSDSAARTAPAEPTTTAIADHLIHFLKSEVDKGRMDMTLNPIQAGIGVIANSVLSGLVHAPFYNMRMYSEVLQDSTFELLDSGKLIFASGSSITLGTEWASKVFSNIGKYKDRLILRPQEISNHPEIIRRLGVIAINTGLEFDIYGNVNSTHVGGTHMMNGIGGSGDFARNAFVSIFVAKSIAKEGAISGVVPMVPHIDHTEHDVDILVTENGLADLRGLAPRERAVQIIDNCAHPIYREELRDYFDRARKTRAGQTPHILEEAFSWHARRLQTGTMRK